MKIEFFTNKPDENRKFDLIEELLIDIDGLYDDIEYANNYGKENEKLIAIQIIEKKLKYKLELLKDLTNAKI